MKVLIKKPDIHAGQIAVLDGDWFKYPGQNFWVRPVRLSNGDRTLITEWEVVDETPDLGLKIDPSNPYYEYDYQECLRRGTCPNCGKDLEWRLSLASNSDDRFCHAVCCAVRYSMVPEKVRIIATVETLEHVQLGEWPDIDDVDTEF